MKYWSLTRALACYISGMVIGALAALPIIGMSAIAGDPALWAWPFFGGVIGTLLFLSGANA